MIKSKPIAVFDIDGTVFRSSLLIELNKLLVEKGVFPKTAEQQVTRVREAWLNRQGSYDDYIATIINLYHRDIRGVRIGTIRHASRALIKGQRHRVYVFTRDLIRQLRKTHTLIIISFSPREVVEEFQRVYDFDIVSGIDYETRNDLYTGNIAPGFIVDKKLILQKLVALHDLTTRHSIGIGDTESDIGFLSLVENPIAFNPNKKLYHTAQRRGWRVVVERKDVIYAFPGLKNSPRRKGVL